MLNGVGTTQQQSHGGHMHAPDVMLRVLGSGIDKAADARAKLAAILTKTWRENSG